MEDQQAQGAGAKKKRDWFQWVGPGLLVLILDRIVKWVHLVISDEWLHLDMREHLSEAPLYYQILVKIRDALSSVVSFCQSGSAQPQVIQNTGMAFGLFKGNSTLILIVSSLLLAACFFLLRGMRPKGLAPVALSMIAGGALGNMIDRLLLGFVIDMFPFFGWFVFNVADVGVVAGAVLCGWSLLLRPQDWSRKEQ